MSAVPSAESADVSTEPTEPTASPALAGVADLRRNRCMMRVLAVWLLFVVNEYAVWTAVLVYAFDRGGTVEAAAASIGQLLPAALLAPVLATVADRRSPVLLLRAGLLAQVGGLLLASTVAWADGPSALVFGGAVVAATAVGAVRPSLSLVVPGVARSAAELATANALVGWLENVGVIAAGLVVGGLLGLGGPAWVLLAGAALVAAALLGTDGLQVARVDPAADQRTGAALGEVTRLLRHAPRPRALVAVITAGWVVVGALDVLFVVLAVDVLHRGTPWAGYLVTAFGVGGVIAVVVTVVVVGRRFGGPVVVAAAVLATALAVLAADVGAPATLLVVVVLGAARAVLEVAATTLLQRSVPSTLTGRVFGVVEGLSMAGMALGALLVPTLAGVGGPTTALLVIAGVVPLGLLCGGRVLRHLDDGDAEPLVEISLLRQVERYADLPLATLQALAATSTRVDVARGERVDVRGRYAIAGGEAEIRTPGHASEALRRGDTLGDDRAPDTEVFARTPLTLLRLDDATVRLTRADRDASAAV